MLKYYKHRFIALIIAYFFTAICLNLSAQNKFTKSDTISCGDSIIYKNLGYPSWIIPEIIRPPQYGDAVIKTDGVYSSMQYQAPVCFKGIDTIVVLCAKATQISCDTGMYILNINCKEVADQVEVKNMNCNDSVTSYLSGFGVAQITEGPFNGKAILYRGLTDLDSLVYYPDSIFSGMDYIKLSLFGGVLKSLIIYHVNCKLPSNTNESDSEELIVFPNPVSGDRVIISASIQTVRKLFLINAQGIPLFFNYSHSTDTIIGDVSNLPNGIYTLILQGPNKNHPVRLLILH
jgi:hypothetical protein